SRDQQADASWIIKCEYSSLNWRITARGLRYVFESDQDVKFFFVNEYRSIDRSTGKVGYDTVNVLASNINPKVLQAKPWTPDTAYAPGSIVVIERTNIVDGLPSGEANYYECLVAHNSGTEFSTAAASLDTTKPQEPKAVLVEY